jgi:membrane-associated protease RseP (regulator of RpoE activity)
VTDTIDRSGAPADSPARTGSSPQRLAILAGLLVLLGVLAGYGWIVIIVAIVVMIFLHELGHYLTARWAGMKVTEFFIGFGPRLWSFRRGETEYGVKLLPAGAYVRVIGMSNLEEVDPADEPRTYRQGSYARRLSVGVAGSAMHFLQAIVLLAISLAFVGLPNGTMFGEQDQTDARWVIGSISEDSAAERAGLREGDKIVAYEGAPITVFEDIKDHVRDDAGETVTITVLRDGREIEIEATIGRRSADQPGGEPGTGFLGVGPTEPIEDMSIIEASGRSFLELGRGIEVAVTALGSFFTGGLDDFADQVVHNGDVEVSTPTSDPSRPSTEPAPPPEDPDANRLISIYGISRLGAGCIEADFGCLFVLLAQINIFIGVFNLIPLLPLDGGHVALATYERLRSRAGRRYRADVAKLLPLTYAVVVVLIVLGIGSLYLDIVDPVGG